MRIISNFVDYYDCCQKNGINMELVYVREEKIVKYSGRHLGSSGNKNNYPFIKEKYKNFDSYYNTGYIIGFCNKVYPLYQDVEYGCIKGNVYNVNELDKYFTDNTKFKQSIINFFDTFLVNNNYSDLFSEYPVFVANNLHRTITFNAKLKNYEFYKIFPVQQAFQELEMWFANKANPNKLIPEISNNDMIEAKGFDLKYSFRKRKYKHDWNK